MNATKNFKIIRYEDPDELYSEKLYDNMDEAIKAHPELVFTRTNNKKKRYSSGTFVAAEGHRRE